MVLDRVIAGVPLRLNVISWLSLQLRVMTYMPLRGDYRLKGAKVLIRRFICLKEFPLVGRNVSSMVAGGTPWVLLVSACWTSPLSFGLSRCGTRGWPLLAVPLQLYEQLVKGFLATGRLRRRLTSRLMSIFVLSSDDRIEFVEAFMTQLVAWGLKLRTLLSVPSVLTT